MVSHKKVSFDSEMPSCVHPTERTPSPPRTYNRVPRSTNSTSTNSTPSLPSKRKREDENMPAKPAKAPKTKKMLEPDRKILVAVDFGTTFSGLAWAQTREPGVQKSIQQWPDAVSEGCEGRSSEKVPTEIRYDGQDVKWGFQIEPSAQRQQLFKLDLDPSQLHTTALASKYRDSRRAPPTYNKDPEQIPTDFLTALRVHTKQTLDHQLPKSVLISTPIEYIVTVPAVWSDKACASTQACAEQAGMGSDLQIVSEPEAAAMYALHTMDPHNIEVGDTFVVCDAGGGTVDLISYKVLALKPKLRIVEASTGTGYLCGSSFLNLIFQKFIENKLGHLEEWDEEVLEDAMKGFESEIKRQFQGVDGVNFMVPVPGLLDDPRLPVLKGKLEVTGLEMKNIFDPVVNEVLQLVKGQIEATKNSVKAVLLVGGFSENRYLRKRIREAVGSIEVILSPNSWTAVVRGALLKALASSSPAFSKVNVAGRCARKHYGFIVETKFVAETHELGRRYWHGYKGCHMILQMSWFAKKGEVVKEDKPCRLKYRHLSPQSKGPVSTIDVDIYAHEDPHNFGAPQYKNDNNGITKLATIAADLSRISNRKFPTETGADGEVWYVIDYEIRVTYCSAYTKYEPFYKRTSLGVVKAEYV